MNYKPKKRTVYFSQLKDLIESHVDAGLTNPAFKYDPESFFWFVNFEMVGSTGRKIPLQAVNRTVISIIASLNLWDMVPGFRIHKYFEKYREAIDVFYAQRSRPDGKRILCPTFQGCGPIEPKELPFDRTRDFWQLDLVV